MTPKHRGGSVSAGIRIAVTVSGGHWFAAPVFDGMTDVEAWEEAEWALPSDAERRRFTMSTAEIASLRELVKELREAGRAVVGWRDAIEVIAPQLGGTLRAIYQLEDVIAKADKATGDE